MYMRGFIAAFPENPVNQVDINSNQTDALSPAAHEILAFEQGRRPTPSSSFAATATHDAADRLRMLKPEQLLTKPVASLPDAKGLLAGLWLWHDWLDSSHTISQDIHTPTGSFWHAIMHRREGDFCNAKYWYARCQRHPTLAAMAPTPTTSSIPCRPTSACCGSSGMGWDPTPSSTSPKRLITVQPIPDTMPRSCFRSSNGDCYSITACVRRRGNEAPHFSGDGPGFATALSQWDLSTPAYVRGLCSIRRKFIGRRPVTLGGGFGRCQTSTATLPSPPATRPSPSRPADRGARIGPRSRSLVRRRPVGSLIRSRAPSSTSTKFGKAPVARPPTGSSVSASRCPSQRPGCSTRSSAR